MIAAEEVAPDKRSSFAAISLSRNIVADKTNANGNELEDFLKILCKRFVAFSIALDESTDVDTTQLAVFIHGVTEDSEIFE